MQKRVEKPENTSKVTAAKPISSRERSNNKLFQLVDNRPEAAAWRDMQVTADNGIQVKQSVQLQAMADAVGSRAGDPVKAEKNNTGLPDQLKTGIENLSGYAMDDVKVNYNSEKPAQMQAHAYAQGTDIHIAPGQEKQLPHEAWHVAQQKAGRVKPTMQMKEGIQINDDRGLEKEADVMGAKAVQAKMQKPRAEVLKPAAKSVQLKEAGHSGPEDSAKTLEETTARLKTLLESSLAGGWNKPDSPEATKLKSIISFLEEEAKKGEGHAESINRALAHELGTSPLGKSLIKNAHAGKSEKADAETATVQQQAIVQKVGAEIVVAGVIGLGMLIYAIYQYRKNRVRCSLTLVGKMPRPRGGMEALVRAEAWMTASTQYVEYDIRWSANAVPGGNHLQQVPNQASPGWVLDRDAHGNPIGDRTLPGNVYYNLQEQADQQQGTHFLFHDDIQQNGLVTHTNQVWGFRLRVFNANHVVLRTAEITINW